jgi:O-antigen/teichoic acid export membrane protein
LTDVRSNAELTEATATGLRWVMFARLGTELILLVSMVVLARLIPPSAFGMFAIAVIVQELAVNVPGEGVGSALVQRKTIERAHLEGALAVSLLSGAVLAIAALLLVQVLVRPVFGDETAFLVALTTPWFLMGGILAIPLAVLRRQLDFRRLSLLSLAQNAVRTVASVALAVMGMDASALVLGALAGMFAIVGLAVLSAPVPLPRWRSRAIRDLLSYGAPAALAAFSWAGFRNGDYAIVGARLGAAQAGFYWRGFQLAVEYQRKVSAVMTQIAFPVLSRTAGADAMFELRRRMVRLLTVVVFPLLALLVLLAPVVVPWLFGPAWEPAVLPTQILAGAGATTVVIDAVGSVLMAAGRARALLGYGIAHFAVYAGAVLFASGHGLAAVSAAAVIVHFAFLIVAYRVLLRDRAEPTLRFIWGDVSAATVSCVALVAVAWPAGVALEVAAVPVIVHIALVCGIGSVAYLATLRIGFVQDYRDLIRLVRRVLPDRPVRAAARRVPVLAGRSS